jgi:apolipoprotein N-acyltransferase
VGTEWASPKLFGDTLGYGLYPSLWMRQAADLGGVHGLTFLLVIANECVLAVMRVAVAPASAGRARVRRALVPAASVTALVLGLLGYGAARCWQLAGESGNADAVAAGVVQPDISHYERLRAQLGTFDAVRTILDVHFALSADALGRADLDLLVWPETAYPTTFGTPKSEAGAAFDREIAAFAAKAGVPLVFGAYDLEGGDEFNAAVFLEPATQGPLTFETYRKAWLFPLTERAPAVLQSDLVRAWLPWLGTWKPGGGPKVVSLALRDGRTVRIAPHICYDVLDPGLAAAAVRQGAELIVTLSNDSWFAAGPGPRMHLVGAAFRSIETHRPQLRATNTGISAVIDPTGDLLATAGVHERAILLETVIPERRATTLVLAWGDWFGPSALAAGAVLLATALGRRRLRSAPT